MKTYTKNYIGKGKKVANMNIISVSVKVEELLKRKDPTICLDSIVKLDQRVREVIVEVENLQSKRRHVRRRQV